MDDNQEHEGDVRGSHPYRRLSLWWEAIDHVTPRPSMNGDCDVDVCIVGAGFTGLWTAHSLIAADPTLRIVVVEHEVAGYGASGRNGGWCSALFAASDELLARKHGKAPMRAMRNAMQESIDVVGATAAAEGIDCHFAKGGTIVAARSKTQRQYGLDQVAQSLELGGQPDDLRWLEPDEARTILGATDVLGATFTPHCAAIQPALLTRGLADAVERRGVTIYERTPATAIVAGSLGKRPQVRTPHGQVTADVVVRALEGFTAQMPGQKRDLVPVYSLMVATEPLSSEVWDTIGLAERSTFADFRHMVIYGQRTADNRIAFGGRGAPYHFGSAIHPGFDDVPDVHDILGQTLVELFPVLAEATITHRWGGPLGVPRDWYSSVGFHRESGFAWSGGYVGDGVTTSNLGGRTLADLIVGRDSDLVHLPWVGHHSPQWEPEPLRWMGVNAGLWAMRVGDRSEQRRDKPSKIAAAMGRLLGH